MAKRVNKITRQATKRINKAVKKNPGATVAATAAIATTSAIGVGTVITGIIRMPGALKRRFGKMDLPNNADNTNNDATTDTTTTTTDTTADDTTATTTTTTTTDTENK